MLYRFKQHSIHVYGSSLCFYVLTETIFSVNNFMRSFIIKTKLREVLHIIEEKKIHKIAYEFLSVVD